VTTREALAAKDRIARESARSHAELAAFDINISRWKSDARRLLPPDHALLKILRRTPDSLPAAVLLDRLDDWLALLEDDP
jgi:hypothetical protein